MIGKTIGVYEVGAMLGEGGMGQVYRARDTKLNRDVALKVLPPSLVDDPDRLARFRREAQVLASLKHPNIATIHGFEDSGETHALVLELVEGEDLSQRIARGAIPLDEALPIARQIAEALEAAHEQGIIHRDLKPANVKVTPDGVVKVLDFGLAKALDPDVGRTGVGSAADADRSSVRATASSSLTLANSPTFTAAAATQAGFILGTAAYMSPEQAKGRPLDKRTDIWAYGVVLYEMLTGRQTFGASDVSDTLAAVLRKEVDLADLPSETPAPLRRLLRRCLERDRKLRLPDIAMARLEIAEAAEVDPDASPASESVAPARQAFWQRPVGIAAIAIAALAAGGLAAWSLGRPTPAPKPLTSFGVTLPEGMRFSNSGRHVVAAAPDGSFFVHTANDALWIRRRSDLESTRMPGTEDAREPFVSPDSLWIGFEVDGQLLRVAAAGGAPIPLASIGPPFGASWGADGAILIGQGGAGVVRVPETGGTVETIVEIGEAGARAFGPQMLDEEWILFSLRPPEASWDEAQIVVQSLETNVQEVLFPGADARYLPSGHLVYVVGGVLFGVAFDVESRTVTGGPVSLVEGVAQGVGDAQYALAGDGTLVYRPGVAGTGVTRTFVAADLRGETTSFPMVPPGPYLGGRLSPDASKVAYEDEENRDVWVAALDRGSVTLVTTDPGFDGRPLWTPDGQSLVFTSTRDGAPALYQKTADGTGAAEPIFQLDDVTEMRAMGWTPDGSQLVVEVGFGSRAAPRRDIGLVTPGSPGSWEPLIDSDAIESDPALSPDGQWIAYVSRETGPEEVYIQRFPGLGQRQPISVGGGFEPAWSADGTELFYLRAPDGPPVALMRVAMEWNGQTIRPGQPEELFGWDFPDRYGYYRRYDILPDGRFLALAHAETTEVETSPFDLIVIQNWIEDLKARVPVNR